MWWARDGVALLSCFVPHESRVVPTSGCVHVLDMCVNGHTRQNAYPGCEDAFDEPSWCEIFF